MIWATIDEESVCLWATGLIYPILKAILYPIRAYKNYNGSITYYQKHNISWIQFLFGKRVKRN